MHTLLIISLAVLATLVAYSLLSICILIVPSVLVYVLRRQVFYWRLLIILIFFRTNAWTFVFIDCEKIVNYPTPKVVSKVFEQEERKMRRKQVYGYVCPSLIENANASMTDGRFICRARTAWWVYDVYDRVGRECRAMGMKKPSWLQKKRRDTNGW